MQSLVGFTGFVGSNIASQAQFNGLYNSKNIADAFGTKPDLLVYAGVRAEKFLANKEPDKDRGAIDQAADNIRKIAPGTLVLISTIDVYGCPVAVDEDSPVETAQPYGKNRHILENWVEENIRDYLIVRLPALYGQNIKKNFVFDMIHLIPSMLHPVKYAELAACDPFLERFYEKQENGFYKCRVLAPAEKASLKDYFRRAGFSALSFTDSRASYQFYNLEYLWGHIQAALDRKIPKLNLATEPVTAAELYRYVRGSDFINEISPTPAEYNFRSKHAALFGGKNGYLFDREFILRDIKKFVEVYGI